MLSRAERARRALEWALRMASVLLVAWMLWLSRPRPADTGARVISQSELASALAVWTATPPADTLHVLMDSTPGREEREWLRALSGAGTSVSWSARAVLPAVALEVQPRNDPMGGVIARIAVPAGARVRIRDAASPIDSMTPASRGGEIAIPFVTPPLSVRVGTSVATAVAADSLLFRKVVVLGRAGWEGKFAVAALEERGWTVDARLSVAPGIDVTQGSPTALDTSRVGAVIALDSTAARDAARIAAFVRSGGGLVLEPEAAAQRALSALAAGGVGARERAPTLAFADAAPRRALALYAVTPLRPDAVALEHREGRVAAAARRVGSGRVIQLGYDETWRWRMSGGDGAMEAHRRWWTQVVGAAAYEALRPTRTPMVNEAAPLAMLHAALGAPRPAPPSAGTTGQRGLRLWMMLALGAMLLAEWGSRRMRGAS